MNDGTTSSAITVTNGVFSYGRGKKKEMVLDGINLDVPRGAIYALLGPSGCGKTTLISCLAYIRTLDKGQISIFGTRPGSKKSGVPGPWLGLMPQELSLYEELSIVQTLTYFGRLHLLKKEELADRIEFLIEFLELPRPNALLRDLSGGQQRRVSLAVALIHTPPLLVLDEPTVGLDPAISSAIWGHLLHLSRTEGMTILLTTHYIEEARKANLVGMMRRGQILVEGNPESLIRQLRVKTLEHVFLIHCLREDHQVSIKKKPGGGYFVQKNSDSSLKPLDNLDEETAEQSQSLLPKNTEMQSFEMHDLSPSQSSYNGNALDPTFLLPVVKRSYEDHFRIVYALVVKSLQRLRRNLPFLVFVFCLPCIIVFMMRTVFGLEPFDLPIGVVNEDELKNQSQDLLSKIDKDALVQTLYEGEKEAVRAMQNDLVIGTVIFGQNFTDSLYKRFQDSLLNDTDVVRSSFVHLQMTTTNPLRLRTAFKSVTRAYGEMTAHLAAKMQGNPDSARSSLTFMSPIFAEGTSTQSNFISSGGTCGVLYMVGLACSSMTFLDEFNRGVVNLNRAAGVSAIHLILSHMIIQYTITFFHITSLTIFIYACGIASEDSGSPAMVATILLFQTTVGIAQGFFLSTIIQSMFKALVFLITLQSMDFSLAGYMWPLEGNPYWLRYLGLVFSPTAANIRALRFVLTRGLGFTHNTVWFAFLVSIFWVVLSFLGVTVMLH